MAIENYVGMLCDIFRTQVHRDAKAAGIKRGSHPGKYKEFYYNGRVPLVLEVFNNNYILPYAYATSVLKRNHNVENRQKAFPLYSDGKSQYSDLMYPTDYDRQTKATANAQLDKLHMMAHLMKRNWWPEGVCLKRDNVRCPKPSKGARPDIMVEIPANGYFAFPVPVLHVEVVGKKTVFGEVEFKGWVAALNALAMMPTSYYVEVYHDHWALYRFSRNEIEGRIEVEKTRYEMICGGMEKFGSTFSDLSTAILRAMFDIISHLDTVRHAQYDLDDIGKQHGKSKSGNQIEVCDECFDFDPTTIEKMMTVHRRKFLDGPRDDKENLRTPEASDEETEPFYADDGFEASNLCNPLQSVNVRRRCRDTEETAFMSPHKTGPGGDGVPEPRKSHGKSSGKDRTSKGGDRSGEDRTRKGGDRSGEDRTRKDDDSDDDDDDSNTAGPKGATVARNIFQDEDGTRKDDDSNSESGKGDDSNTEAGKGDDSNGDENIHRYDPRIKGISRLDPGDEDNSKRDDRRDETSDETRGAAAAAAAEGTRRKREESSSTDSSTSSVKQRLLTGQRNKRRRTNPVQQKKAPGPTSFKEVFDLSSPRKQRAMMKMMTMKKHMQQAAKTKEQEEDDAFDPRKEETKDVKQGAQAIEKGDDEEEYDEEEDEVNVLPLYNQPPPGMPPNQPAPGVPPYPLQTGGPAIRPVSHIPPIQPASGIPPNPLAPAHGIPPNTAAPVITPNPAAPGIPHNPAAPGIPHNPVAPGMPPTKQDTHSTVKIAAKAKTPSPNRKVSPTKRDTRDKRPEWDECKNQ